IAFNVIFIPIIGFMASAWATLLAYGTMMVVSYFWGQKYYRIPYKTRKIGLYVVLSIGLALANYYLFNSSLIIGNFMLLIYIAIAIFIEKSSLELGRKQNIT